ncbi:unnamed protein product [marine sediment metagenome]|uniref:Uncharacterized protein n=1 Tax=marine sediment metagenome TaxID=412755 RepID=X1D8L8_9ZZZZ
MQDGRNAEIRNYLTCKQNEKVDFEFIPDYDDAFNPHKYAKIIKSKK